MTRRGFIRRVLAAVCGAVACVVVGRRVAARPAHDLRAICRAMRRALPWEQVSKVRVFEAPSLFGGRDEVVVLTRARSQPQFSTRDGVITGWLRVPPNGDANVGYAFEVDHPVLAHPGRVARRVRDVVMQTASWRGPWCDEFPREYWWFARGIPWPDVVPEGAVNA